MTNQIGVRYAHGTVEALRFEEIAEETVEGAVIKFPKRGRVTEQVQLERDLQAFDEAIREGASEAEAFDAAICGYKPNVG